MFIFNSTPPYFSASVASIDNRVAVLNRIGVFLTEIQPRGGREVSEWFLPPWQEFGMAEAMSVRGCG
jgi:hypothetical protein